MEDKSFNIFKIEYDWYEGERGETFLGKNVEREEFEKDLLEARDFAKSLLGKKEEMGDYLGEGYSVECLPQYYSQIIWFLVEKKGYTDCYLEEDTHYSINDNADHNISSIGITRSEETVNHTEL